MKCKMSKEIINIQLEDFANQVSILQIKEFDAARIRSYLKSISRNNIILFAEYIFNPFFVNLRNATLKDFEKSNKEKFAILREYSKEFNDLVIIPFVELKKNVFYKNLALIHGDLIYYYPQKTLISYSHWDERNFFGNTQLDKKPFYFSVNETRFGVIFGFEAHFDEYWLGLKKNNIDAVLIPTACAFNSHKRWLELLKVHAFTNSCYVLRANKLGAETARDGIEWDFYGDSFAILGDRIIDGLEDREGVLCVDIEREKVRNLANEWGFRDA